MPTIDLKPLVLECIDFYRSSTYSPFNSVLLRELEDDLALVVYANAVDGFGEDLEDGPLLVIMLCSLVDYTGRLTMLKTENGLMYLMHRDAVCYLCDYGACSINFITLDALTDFDVVLTPCNYNCREYHDFLKLTQYMTLTKPVPEPEPLEIDTLL